LIKGRNKVVPGKDGHQLLHLEKTKVTFTWNAQTVELAIERLDSVFALMVTLGKLAAELFAQPRQRKTVADMVPAKLWQTLLQKILLSLKLTNFGTVRCHVLANVILDTLESTVPTVFAQ
jgi:hypothetical protein